MKFLANLSVAARVGGLSAIAVIAIGVLLSTALYSQRVVSNEIVRLADYSEMEFFVSEVLAHAQAMRRSQKDFMLGKDTSFVEEYGAEFEKANTGLDRAGAKTQAAPIHGNLENLRDVLTRHKAQFESLAGNLTEMGLNEKSGLQGALRSAVHNVEEKLKKAGLDALTVKMLMMRRHEKDFMLRGADKYIGRIDDRRTEFAALLPESGLSAEEQEEINALLDTYQSAFKAYAAKAKEIEAALVSIEETYAEIAPEWALVSDVVH